MLRILTKNMVQKMPREIKSLRVEGLKEGDFFGMGITRKKYYKVLVNDHDMGVRAWVVDDHGVRFPGHPKTLYDRIFVKRFTPLKTKIKCNCD